MIKYGLDLIIKIIYLLNQLKNHSYNLNKNYSILQILVRIFKPIKSLFYLWNSLRVNTYTKQ